MAEDSNEFVPPPLAGFQKKIEDAVEAAETEQQPGRSVSDVVFDAMKEVAERDTDDDGLPDVREQALGTNPLDPDTDDDGLADGVEIKAGFDPTVGDVPKYEAEHDNPFGDVELPVPPGMSLPETPAKRSAPRSHQPDQHSEVPPGGDDADGRRAFLDHALDQVGDKGQFGAEVAADAEDADAWDSGELVEWAAKQAGVDDMPDGTWRQYRFVHEQGADLEPADALRVPGALLFSFSSDPLKPGAIPSQRQVAISLGDGHVLEVTESGGVRVVEADPSQYTHAGLISGFPGGNDATTTALVDGKLRELDIEPGTFETGPGPMRSDEPGGLFATETPKSPGTVDQGLDLAKRAEDARDRSDELRAQADEAEGRAQALENKADALRSEANTKAAAAQEAIAGGDTSGSALQTEAAALRTQATRLDEQLTRMNAAIGTTRQQVNELTDEARKLDLDANEILSQVAPPPPRNILHELPGEQHEKRAEEEFENIAESRRLAAGVADGRAAEARARIEAEQERVRDLDGRIEQAQARADEYAAQHGALEDEWERLHTNGDPAADAVAQRADYIMHEQSVQDAEVSRLRTRRETAEQTIAEQTDAASDYDEIAADLRTGAANADQAAAQHRDAVDKVDDSDGSDVVGDTPGSAAAAAAGAPLSMDLDRDDDGDTDAGRETDDGFGEPEPDPAAVVQQQIAAIDNSADSLMVDDVDSSVSDAGEAMDPTDTRDSLDDDFDTIA
jgi:hypothetical protein